MSQNIKDLEHTIAQLLNGCALLPDSTLIELYIDPWGTFRDALRLCSKEIQDDVNAHWQECTGKALLLPNDEDE